MAMEFVKGQFDCVVCFNSISHFPSIPQVLEKICGLLSRRGKAIFNVFTQHDVAFGVGEKLGKNTFFYRDTLFHFASESEIKKVLQPFGVTILHSETRRWEEPDHGSYRTGTHTHEACFFIVKRG